MKQLLLLSTFGPFPFPFFVPPFLSSISIRVMGRREDEEEYGAVSAHDDDEVMNDEEEEVDEDEELLPEEVISPS